MAISLTALRKNIFYEVDQVIVTGKPVEIERKGYKLKIIIERKESKLSSLVKRAGVINCSDEELVSNDWLKY